MSYATLANLVSHMRQTLQQGGLALTDDLRLDAANLAILTHGRAAMELKPMVNIAALALSMDRLTVYRLDESAIEQVEATDIRSTPPTAPRLLRDAFLLESRLPAHLTPGIHSIAGYRIGQDWWLISAGHPDGMYVHRWRPAWGEGDIESTVPQELDRRFVEERLEGEYLQVGQASARFVVTFAILLECENTPVEQTLSRETAPRPAAGRGAPNRRNRPDLHWSIRSITIPQARRPSAPAREAGGQKETDGLRQEPRTVRGFMRRQPHGPRNELRKWVYIDSFERRQWVSTVPTRINVRGSGHES